MRDKWTKFYNQWLKGELPAEDQHRMERQALDDPFLGDALEGIELYHGEHKSVIQDRLEQRLYQPNKKNIFWLWKYAAAASIALVAAAYLLIQPNNDITLKSDAYAIEYTSLDDGNEASTTSMKSMEANNTDDRGVESSLISHGNPDNNPIPPTNSTQQGTMEISTQAPTVSTITKEDAEIIVSNDLKTKSGIGSSTRLVLDESSDTRSLLSDNSEIAKRHTVPAPSAIPVAIAESDDPMPIHESSATSYIPNVNHTGITGDTLPKTTFPEIGSGNRLTFKGLDSQIELLNSKDSVSDALASISINGRSLAVPNTNESLVLFSGDTIKPIIELLTLDPFGNEIDGYPLIGWAAFDSLLMTEMPDKVDMFMQGVKDVDWNRLRIMVDSTGKVIQFNSGAMSTDGVERALEKTGKWQTNNKSAIIIHKHKIFSKEKN